MLSAQADELRELAGDGGMEWVIGPIRVATLHGAADTILSLCDRVQELQAENAKLREELEAVGTAAYLYGRDDLKTENAKLRQAFNETLARLVAANEVTVNDYMDDDYCELLRELGIEVD